MTFEANRRIVVSAIAGDDCYFVSACSETSGEISEVLCRRNHIRVKTLIEEQDFQLAEKCPVISVQPLCSPSLWWYLFLQFH